MSIFPRVLLLAVVAASSGCTPNQAYRESDTPTPLDRDCARDSPASKCSFILTERQNDPDKYTLAVVEFDDQGLAHLGGRQLREVTRILAEPSTPSADTVGQIVVVFAHGWRNNARPGNTNLAFFGKILEGFAAAELNEANIDGRKPRRVVGVYFGWRGAAFRSEEDVFSFWNRKDAAHRIGEREAGTALIRIRNIVYSANFENPQKRNRFIVLGHSFGGALIYSALHQLLANTFLDPAKGFVHPAASVGAPEPATRPAPSTAEAPPVADAVILFNAAFEAARIHYLLETAGQNTTRGPTLSLLTSKSDWATRVVFPLGRWFDTLFQRYEQVGNPIRKGTLDERASNTHVPGHFSSFITHDLRAITNQTKSCPQTGGDLPSLHDLANKRIGGGDFHHAMKARLDRLSLAYARGKPLSFGTTCLVPREDLIANKLGIFNISMDDAIWHGHDLEQDAVHEGHINSFLTFFIPFAAGLSREPLRHAAGAQHQEDEEGKRNEEPAPRSGQDRSYTEF